MTTERSSGRRHPWVSSSVEAPGHLPTHVHKGLASSRNVTSLEYHLHYGVDTSSLLLTSWEERRKKEEDPAHDLRWRNCHLTS